MDILVSGQFSNGKSHVAEYLCDQLNHQNQTGQWINKALATPVKQIYMQAFNKSAAFIEKWKRIPEPPPGMLMTVRQALQMIGDGFRQVDPNCWIEICMRDTIQKIISDGRYLSEARYIRDHKGVNVVVYRPGYLNDDPNGSEAEIRGIVDFCLATNQNGQFMTTVEQLNTTIPYHYFLRNDGTLDDLNAKIVGDLIPFIRERYVPLADSSSDSY